MTEPITPPSATPPPRVKWLRTCVIVGVALHVVIALFAPPPAGLIVSVLLALVATPALLIWWTWNGFLRQSPSEGQLRFRRLWTWVWLGTGLTAAALFSTSTKWQNDAFEMVLRLAVIALLTWTTLLMVIAWDARHALGRKAFWKRIVFVAAALATLVAMFYAEENISGKMAWNHFKAEWEPKGAKFTYAEVLPLPVPDELNLAMHPLLKPALDYTLDAAGHAVWRDTNAYERLNSLTAHPLALRNLAAKSNLTSFAHWPTVANSGVQNRTNGVELADLTKWQSFYRLDTNFAQLPAATNPAADVLRYLERHQTNLALLDEALARPHSQFPIHLTNSDPGRILLPHLANVRMITLLTTLRATAHLEVGSPNDALRDFERALRLCRAMESEPFIMSYLIQVSIQAFTLGVAAHGCAKHQWEDAQLARIQELLRPVQPLRNLAYSLRTEAVGYGDWSRNLQVNRGAAERLVTAMASAKSWDDTPLLKTSPEFGRGVMRHAPAGWFWAVQAYGQRILLEEGSAVAAAAGRQQVDWQRPPSLPPQPWFFAVWPFRSMPERQGNTFAKCARIQTNLDHARLALALERHWLRHRAYPERLDALVPAFLDRLPHDLFDGQPMRYRREGDGFVLWSVGFDGKDDNAGPLQYGPKGGSVGEETGDLVWRYPQAK